MRLSAFASVALFVASGCSQGPGDDGFQTTGASQGSGGTSTTEASTEESTGTAPTTGVTQDSAETGATAGETGDTGTLLDVGFQTGTDTEDVDVCDPPHLQIVLDRSASMAKLPNGDETNNNWTGTRWGIAVDVLEAVTVMFEEQIDFGLELFPPSSPGCLPQHQCLDFCDMVISCEPADLIVVPQPLAATEIDTALDVFTTPLCWGTPIAAAIGAANGQLDAVAQPGRDQAVLLVTDGQETCTLPGLFDQIHTLAKDNIKTYVVGFSANWKQAEIEALNNAACAGHTAVDFPNGCVADQDDNYLAEDPAGPTLFHEATEAMSLQVELEAISSNIGCVPQ